MNSVEKSARNISRHSVADILDYGLCFRLLHVDADYVIYLDMSSGHGLALVSEKTQIEIEKLPQDLGVQKECSYRLQGEDGISKRTSPRIDL